MVEHEALRELLSIVAPFLVVISCTNMVGRMNTFVWDNDLLSQLLTVLDYVHVLKVNPDSWLWEPCPSGGYSTSSAYEFLCNRGGVVISIDTFSSLCKIKMPNKTLCLLWRSFRDRLPMKVNLFIRNIIQHLNYLLYTLCQQQSEFVHHIFIHCNVARVVWHGCYSWISISFLTVFLVILWTFLAEC